MSPIRVSLPRLSDSCADAASHNRIVFSPEPETMGVPSGENATDETRSECPCSGSPMAVPDAASHNRIVLSSEPETMLYRRGRMQRMRPSQPLSVLAEALRWLCPMLHPIIE